MNWKGKRIGVMGDVMLDEYVIGSATRISPEAPVIIVDVEKEKFVIGGAANAAANIVSLCGKANLFGLVGADPSAEHIRTEALSKGIDISGVYADPSRPTTHKTRVMVGQHQLCRIDREIKQPEETSLSEQAEVHLIRSLRQSANETEGYLISDYKKGLVNLRLMKEIISLAAHRNKPVVVDPKPVHKSLYHGVSLITPNRLEAAGLVGLVSLPNMESVVRAGTSLLEELSSNVLITLGEEGMYLFEKGEKPKYIEAHKVTVNDVSGAGDTVAAVMTLGLSSGISLYESARIANRAAGIKVTKIGTTPVDYHELFSG